MWPFARCAGMLAVVALLLLAACDSPKEKEAKYIGHGKELYEGGDFVKAALEFKNALQINPAGTESQYYLGLIAEKQHNVQAAVAAFRRAADGDSHNFDAHRKAGQYALMVGDTDTAKEDARDLIEIAPDKPDGHTMMAAVLLMESKLPEAEQEANKALELAPNNVDALVVLASQRARNQQLAGALEVIERGLKINPESSDLLLVKLRLLFDQKQTDGVIAVLQQLHKIDPSNPNYVIDLANQLASAKRLDEAEAVYRQSLDANADSDQLISGYAGFLIANASLEKAIEEVKSFVDKDQGGAKYVLLLEQLYLKASKYDEAGSLMANLQQNGKLAGDRLQAQTELARIAVLKGNTQGGLDQLKAVLDQDPDNESALLLRASIKLGNSSYDEAIGDARSVLHGDIGSVPALNILSRAYVATGDTDLAIDTLRKLLQLSPTDIDARLQLATLLAPNSLDDTLQNLDAAIALRPDAHELTVQKAEYLIRNGRPDKAELIGRDLMTSPDLAGTGHRLIGEAALARADYATAIAEFNQAQAAGEPFASFGRMLVAAYIQSGKSGDAESLLKSRIAANPGDSNTLVLLAAMKSEAKQFNDSENLLLRAIAAQPDNKESYQNLVQLYQEQRKYDDAIKIAGAATAKFPDDRNLLILFGVTSDVSGHFEEAKATYEKVLNKWPSDVVAANNLAALISDVWQTTRRFWAAPGFSQRSSAIQAIPFCWIRSAGCSPGRRIMTMPLSSLRRLHLWLRITSKCNSTTRSCFKPRVSTRRPSWRLPRR